MCGSTSAQNQISDEQNAFYKQLTQQYGTQFSQNQNILGALTKTFSPILASGPNQEGFSADEKTAMNTAAGEGTAADFAKAQQGTSEALAARGGGNAFVPSGADTQILAGNSNAAAAQEATAKNNIVQNDYATGRSNFYNAASALAGTAEAYSPTNFASATTNAGQAAGTTANQIASQQNSVWQGVVGAGAALGSAALGPHP